MTRAEIFAELEKVRSGHILITEYHNKQKQYIMESKDIDEDTLGLLDYDDDEETDMDYSFTEIEYICEKDMPKVEKYFAQDIEEESDKYIYFEDEEYVYKCDTMRYSIVYKIIEKKEK